MPGKSKRKPDPEKYCEYCKERMFRKRYKPTPKHPEGRLQDLTQFMKLRFCCRRCELAFDKDKSNRELKITEDFNIDSHRKELEDVKSQCEIYRKEIENFNKSRKDYVSQETLANMLISEFGSQLVIHPPKQVKIPEHVKSGDNEEEVNLVLSDWHEGEIIDPKEIGGLNEYSPEIAKERILKIFDGSKSIIARQRKVSVINVLNIWCVGDLPDGAEIYPGQAYYQIKSATEQILTCANYLASYAIDQSKNFNRINIIIQPGNHGEIRSGSKRRQKLNVNYEYIMGVLLKTMLQEYSNIKVNVSEAWFYLVEVMGHSFMLTHGANIKSWMQIPFYGIERQSYKWRDLLSEHGEIECIVMGHFHISADIPTNTGRTILLNGCLSGQNLYSTEKLGAGSPPRQWIFGTNKKRAITFSHKLDVI